MIRPAAAIAAALLAAAPAAAEVVSTETGPIAIDNVVTGFSSPWGLAITPGGNFFVTEKGGTLRFITRASGAVSAPITGVPAVVADGQGGLLDVAVHPRYSSNQLIYLTYSEAGSGGVGLAVMRARYSRGALSSQRVIWRAGPKTGGGGHFGSRAVFSPGDYLYVTSGERQLGSPAQDLGQSLGKVVRLTESGGIPSDNPFRGVSGARASTWTLGHRNPQGATFHPVTGELWELEHGPLGGDELNIIKKGQNYGWPLVSWGDNYDGSDIPNHDTRPDFRAPIRWWTPRIAPSNLDFYFSDAIPGWNGNLLLGSLGANAVIRLTVSGQTVTGEERIPVGERVRDIEVAADGAVFILTDNGNLKRITRAP